MTTTNGPAHAFDFWVGEWEVFGPRGVRVGTSSIVGVLGTGALAEHWHGVGGYEGHSLTRTTPPAATGTRPGSTPRAAC